ncbi:MAG: hypothetical protein KDC53_15395 [Saprospiraceae bacterium]|nr:hypothetical protein [Saprospiraceae bacterium]
MWKQIIRVTMIAGVLDLSAASLQVFIMKSLTPDILLEYIASGLFGQAAFEGKPFHMFVGLLVHFFIVFCCVTIYFLLYPKLHLQRWRFYLTGVGIAIIAWIVTTQVIIPFSLIPHAPFHLGRSLLAILILYACIGIPIGYFAEKYFQN